MWSNSDSSDTNYSRYSQDNGYHKSDSNGNGAGYSEPRIKEENSNSLPVSTVIDFSKYEDIPVEISGRDAPKAINEWGDVDLGSILMSNINAAKYSKPTPVQRNSIPIVMSGRDLMSCAQTGSGKTAAFLIPIIALLLKTNPSHDRNYFISPLVVVLAPTRELAIQIYDESKKFSAASRLRSCIIYGGSPIGYQLRELERGCDILIATPGRLNDILDRGKMSLSKVKFLVLDEADRMLDMGFEPQIRRIVQKEDMPSPQNRQTLMFSATFPKQIQELAATFLNDYVFLTIGRVGSTTDLVTQKFVKVMDDNDKKAKLLEIINIVKGLTLIFVETKKKASILDSWLRRYGFASSSIHGDREQAEREAALRNFSSGRTPYLIATNVAARGIDIGSITHVINYDMPLNIDDYVHRIGRTGRAGKNGISTTFLSDDNAGIIPDLLKLLKEAQQVIPPWLENMRYLRKAMSSAKRGNSNRRFGGTDFRSNNRNNSYGQNYGSNYNNYNNNSYYNGNGNNADPSFSSYYGQNMPNYSGSVGQYGNQASHQQSANGAQYPPMNNFSSSQYMYPPFNASNPPVTNQSAQNHYGNQHEKQDDRQTNYRSERHSDKHSDSRHSDRSDRHSDRHSDRSDRHSSRHSSSRDKDRDSRSRHESSSRHSDSRKRSHESSSNDSSKYRKTDHDDRDR